MKSYASLTLLLALTLLLGACQSSSSSLIQKTGDGSISYHGFAVSQSRADFEAQAKKLYGDAVESKREASVVYVENLGGHPTLINRATLTNKKYAKHNVLQITSSYDKQSKADARYEGLTAELTALLGTPKTKKTKITLWQLSNGDDVLLSNPNVQNTVQLSVVRK